MGWTDPRDWTAGEIVTEAIMDTHVKNNLRYLKGIDGKPTIQSGLIIGNSLGSEHLLLPFFTSAGCATALGSTEAAVVYDNQIHRIKMFDGSNVNSVVTTTDVDDTPVNGATTDPVSSNWAYDFLNILTAQADLPYASAAGIWTRLAKGTALQYLRMNAGVTAPEWATVSFPTTTLKTADETISNDENLQNDDHLLQAVGANQTWAIDFNVVVYCANGAPNFKYAITVPAAATVYYGASHEIQGGLNAVDQYTNTGGTAITADIDGGEYKVLLIRCIAITAGTAGNVQFQWAQSTATVADTKVLTGSYLKAVQLA